MFNKNNIKVNSQSEIRRDRVWISRERAKESGTIVKKNMRTKWINTDTV